MATAGQHQPLLSNTSVHDYGDLSTSSAQSSFGGGAHAHHADFGSVGSEPLHDGTGDLAAQQNAYERDAVAPQMTGIFNLANAAIGAGVLAFPFAFAIMGWAAACVVTAVAICTMMYTAIILSRVTAAMRVTNYGVLMERAMGPKWGVVGKIVLTLYLLGACTGYMRVIGDMTVPLAQKLWGDHVFFAQPYFLIPLFSFTIVLPLAMFPRVDFLAPASYIAVFSCLYVAVFIWVDGISHWADHEERRTAAVNVDFKFFQAVPLITFAFTAHPLVPTVFAAIKGHSVAQFRWTVLFGYLICLTLYLPTGIFGFLLYGVDTEGDILLNFPENLVWADIGRAAMAITVIMAYPINLLPARASLIKLFFPGADVKNFGWAYNLATAAIFLVSLVLAIEVPGLQTVFGVFGATFGVTLVFFFPAILHVKFSAPEDRMRAVLAAVFIFAVGLFVGIAGGTMTVCEAIAPCKKALSM